MIFPRREPLRRILQRQYPGVGKRAQTLTVAGLTKSRTKSLPQVAAAQQPFPVAIRLGANRVPPLVLSRRMRMVHDQVLSTRMCGTHFTRVESQFNKFKEKHAFQTLLCYHGVSDDVALPVRSPCVYSDQ